MSGNRLGNESSPYLLQHAGNPVDWQPWGEEAFEEARRRDVPIFLSIGYSTCYWCHVMERESFESEQIAEMLNAKFVCIKVDREQRPDVDEIYMTATQLMTGHGGWPMSVFLEPKSLRPFWCGTYFPATPRENMNMPSMPQVIESISSVWRERRGEALAQADTLAQAVKEQLRPDYQPVGVGAPQIGQAVSHLLRTFDQTHGGFGSAPKFPQPSQLEFLLDVRLASGDEATTAAVDSVLTHTLNQMAVGGLRDQIGGGFHRYSVDASWTVPHFEKMLYDNAQLILVYARAAQAYSDSFFESIARDTAEYVLREMTTPEGAFMSAQDAEVDSREGFNYLWTRDEFEQVLDAEDAAFAAAVYGLDAGPNFRDPHHPDDIPRSVPRLADRPEKVAASMSVSPDEFSARLARVSTQLLSHRSTRPAPSTDDKVLASWNGMMIEALSEAAIVLDEPRYASAAEKAAGFVCDYMIRDGQLQRCSRLGSAHTPGVMEDYAAMILALTSLARSPLIAPKSQVRFQSTALQLASIAEDQFADGDRYADSSAAQTDLFVRPRAAYDGAVSSGGSMMVHALLALAAMMDERSHLDRAVRAIQAISPAIVQSPLSVVNSTRALLRLMRTSGVDRSMFIEHDTPEPHSAKDDFTPVEVYADRERVSVAPDVPAVLNISMRIAEGYHINSADPGPGAGPLVPLRVMVVNGAGVRAYADYPDGEAVGDAPRTHSGQIDMQVVLESEGEWAGQPLLAVTFQACTETECLQPMSVELDLAIDQG